MTETDHAHPDELVVDIACGRSSTPMPMAAKVEEPTTEDVGKILAAAAANTSKVLVTPPIRNG
jgi:exodeoxyribonuclease VIII